MLKKLIPAAIAGLVTGPALAQTNVTISGNFRVGWESYSLGGGIYSPPPTGAPYSEAVDLSADGSVVVGYNGTVGGARRAFRWTGGIMSDLGTIGGTWSAAYGVSADGSTVVGESGIAGGGAHHAFRWTAGGGMSSLGTLGGKNSEAAGVSANGSVVVGNSQITGDSAYHAFRWTQATGMSSLGTLGGTDSWATGVSADGSVIVGSSQNAGGDRRAFRWTGGIMSDLGTLGGTYSYANGVSANGSVVVGESDIAGGASHAFRWTLAAGMNDLGTLGGTYSGAHGVSADGSVVVGESSTAGGGTRAFRWTQAAGMQSVTTWLAGASIAVPAGWTLTTANATSSDGSVVVGNGTAPNGNNQAWVARVGGAGSGLIVDLPAFNNALIESGGRAVQAGTGLSNLALFGAHHRSLLDSGLARSRDGACAWATADAARDNSNGTRMELAEAGVCKDIGSSRLGVGIGAAQARQDWSLGGGAKYDGQYLIAEAASAFGNGIEGSLTGYYGRFDTRINRNYLNGANVDTSRAEPNARASALRLRLDWKDAAKLGPFDLSPYAAITWSKTRLDGYAETGGGFPARFDAAKSKMSDLRIGAAAKTALTAATDLRLGLEAAHRFDDSTTGINGQVVGLWNFSLPGQRVKRTVARATVDFDHRLSNSAALTFGATTAGNRGDTSWGVTAGLRANF